MPSQSEITRAGRARGRAPQRAWACRPSPAGSLPAERDHHLRDAQKRADGRAAAGYRTGVLGRRRTRPSARARPRSSSSATTRSPLIAGSVLAGDRDRRPDAGPAAARQRDALSPSRDLAGGSPAGAVRRHRGGARQRRPPGRQRGRARTTSSTGHDFSGHAVEQALTKGTANAIIDYLDLLAGLALAAGMIMTMVGAMRVGLLPRWMGVLGIFTGVLIFLPIGGADARDRARLLDGHDGHAAGDAGPGATRRPGPRAKPGHGRRGADQRAASRPAGRRALAGAGAGRNGGATGAARRQRRSSRKRRRKRGARSG